MHNYLPRTRCKGKNILRTKYRDGKNNRKTELINSMKKSYNEKIPLYLLKATLKMYRIGKRQAMMAYMESGFKKFTSIHSRLALEMDRHLEETNIPEWMNIRKITLIQKDPLKETPPITIDL